MSKNKHMLLGIGLTVVLTAVGYITLLEPMIRAPLKTSQKTYKMR